MSPRGNCGAPSAGVCSSPERMLLWIAMQKAALCSLQQNQCLQTPNCAVSHGAAAGFFPHFQFMICPSQCTALTVLQSPKKELQRTTLYNARDG